MIGVRFAVGEWHSLTGVDALPSLEFLIGLPEHEVPLPGGQEAPLRSQ